ncbi:conjugative transfer signal peptidase TraF [Rhizobium nepotum]|uniref:conjugative transfer signal peptidase TraF n=1 Tax=Rhizobium nepotum TaxID=1035271 RepID=UPI003369DE81
MMEPVEKPVSPGRRRPVALFCFGATVVAVFGGGLLLGGAGFRINLTPSEPLGIWRISRLDRALQMGDVVFICPPVTDAMREARRRGYLRYGLCAGGVAPLIKSIAATANQRVEIGIDVRIDGQTLAHSRLMTKDGRRRQIEPYAGGTVSSGYVYVHSDFVGSFDSRYFGPLPVENILGLAQEVWTYAP